MSLETEIDLSNNFLENNESPENENIMGEFAECLEGIKETLLSRT